MNADPRVMEFFPRRRPREESDVLMDEVRTRIRDTGLGFFQQHAAKVELHAQRRAGTLAMA